MIAKRREAHVPEVARLRKLVLDSVQGELRSSYRTETRAGEKVFLVIWKRDQEWGTHRALLTEDQAVLVWGRYFSGGEAIVKAYRDFLNRISEAS